MELTNMKFIEYTYLHRIALRFCIEKHLAGHPLLEHMLELAKNHDMDKMFLYTLVSKKAASHYHRATAAHHMENDKPKSVCNFIEAVMDYECAGYTKADKPLNAYDTVVQYGKSHQDDLFHIMQEFGMKRSYKNTPDDPEWKEYLIKQGEITDKVIMRELMEWVNTHPYYVAQLLKAAEDEDAIFAM